MTVFIGVDLGILTGIAVIDSDLNVVLAETWNFTPKKNDNYGKRYLDFEVKLLELFNLYSVAVIGYEKVYRHIGTTA